MQANSLLQQAHQQLKACLHDGALAIDATLGNGHDTLFLAQLVAPSGRVYGFDIQEAAIAATRTRLQQAGLQEHAHLILSSHAQLAEQIPTQHHGQIAAIMFNLGYLPGSDKQIITRTDSTLSALASACRLLATGGMLTILAYPGHAGGHDETAAVQNWAASLNAGHFHCTTLYSNQASASAPRLLVIKKLC